MIGYIDYDYLLVLVELCEDTKNNNKTMTILNKVIDENTKLEVRVNIRKEVFYKDEVVYFIWITYDYVDNNDIVVKSLTVAPYLELDSYEVIGYEGLLAKLRNYVSYHNTQWKIRNFCSDDVMLGIRHKNSQ